MNFPSLADEKADLRRRCYAGRMAIDAEEAKAASLAVAERVIAALGDVAGKTISAYWPLPGELDPRRALTALLNRGAAGALPRMVGDGQPLDFHAWQQGDRLIEGRFKVMEPAPNATVVSPQILLMPLLAFDSHRNRLGHGKGYYDRTLQGLRGKDPVVLAVGMAFAVQEVERVPTDRYDQTLDMVITEKETRRPT